MRHSILILAHQNPSAVSALNEILKSEFDVFLHWDSKTPIPSNLRINRVRCRFSGFWGDISVLEATWSAFGYLFSMGYDTCTVISADCIPLGNAKFIREFIEDKNQTLLDPCTDNSHNKWLANLTLPRALGWWTNPEGIKSFYPDKYKELSLPKINGSRGANWMTMYARDFSEIANVVKSNPEILKLMFLTYAPEETLFQYLFKLTNKTSIGNCRLINWKPRASHPTELTESEIIKAIDSEKYIFGRKVNLIKVLQNKIISDKLGYTAIEGGEPLSFVN